MSNQVTKFYPIPDDLKAKLRAQLDTIKSEPKTKSVDDLKREFIDFLEIRGQREILSIASFKRFETLFEKQMRFKDVVKEIFENALIAQNTKNNLLSHLLKTNKFLTDDYAFLYRDTEKSLLVTKKFMASKSDEELALALEKIKLANDYLPVLAEALLHNRSLERVEAILRDAYGSGESKLSDALDEINIFDQATLRPYAVRRTLQTLLVEVYRKGLAERTGEFNDFTSHYLNGEVEEDRAKFANLLIEKFPHEASEFFQDLAMNENETDDLDVRLEAISHYAESKPRNLAETLWGIITNTRNPRVIFKALTELAKAKQLKLENILERIQDPDSSKEFLVTILRLTKGRLEDFFKNLGSNTQEFFEKLLASVPSLKERISEAENDYSLNEFATGQEFKQDAKPITFIAKILNEGLHLRALFRYLLHDDSETARANAAELLAEVPDEQMQAFHKASYNQDISNALAQALSS